MAIAHSGLCHLGNQCLGVAKQDVQHLAVAGKFLLDVCPSQAICGACALHDRPVGGRP